jgi:hypothetical protein
MIRGGASLCVGLFALTVALIGVAFSEETDAGTAAAGRRTRNYPGLSDTPEGGWTVAEEMNLDGRQGITNTTLDYGLLDVWDAGISVLNGGLYTDGDGPTWNPDLLINLERAVELNDDLHVIVGTAMGTRPWDPITQRLENFTYFDTKLDLLDGQGSIHGGAYYANAALAGGQAAAGYLFGMQIPLLSETLRFNGDYISGNNNLSTASAVLTMKLDRHWQWGLGVQIATPTSEPETTAQIGLYWSDFPEPQQPVGQ